MIYPEDAIGKKFWKRIYEEASKRYGTTNIPVNTFNKVWIVPEKAVVYENAKAGTAYVVESKLKVMLEQDYLALEKNQRQPGDMTSVVSPSTLPNELGLNTKAHQGNHRNALTNALGSQIIREIVLPELTKEVNENKNFSQLRQVYNSLILATWYKKKIKDSILEQVYADQNKIQGLVIPGFSTVIPAKAGIQNKNNVEFIYQRYLQAFKKGVYNYIKEERDPLTQQVIPRKYFSGGMSLSLGMTSLNANSAMLITDQEPKELDSSRAMLVEMRADATSPSGDLAMINGTQSNQSGLAMKVEAGEQSKVLLAHQVLEPDRRITIRKMVDILSEIFMASTTFFKRKSCSSYGKS